MDIVNADSNGSTELVLDLVMSYLPIKDCVRTSILSSGWRYRWTTIPSLVFDRTCYPRSCTFGTKEEGKALASIVSRVLSLHNGSIEAFVLRVPCVSPNIDSWMSRVFRDSLKTFELELWGTVRYRLPSSLFTCGSLSCLKLINCLLMPPPPSFKGFKNLKCLELEYVPLTNDALEKLISSCPLLENLKLLVFNEAGNLKINAPNLQRIQIVGEFVSISLGYAMTKLSVVYIDVAECAYPSLVDFFIKHPSIKRFFFGLMPGDSMLEGFPFQCKDLLHNAISVGFSFPEDSSMILCLCRTSSGMEELRYSHLAIEVGKWEGNDKILAIEELRYSHLAIEVGKWEGNDKSDYEFEELRSVTMDYFSGTSRELEFAEYVLGNSPVLEKVIVNPSDEVKWEDLKSLYEFRRPVGAKIILDRRVT